MGQPERYAWRTSAAFGDAITELREAERAFIAEVIVPWNTEHDPIRVGLSAPLMHSLDRVVIGFHPIPDGNVPAGLSASKKRSYLLPARGAPGEEYRRVMKRLNRIPSMDAVFAAFNAPVYTMGAGSLSRVGITYADGAVYVSCKLDILGGKAHSELTPVKLSVFYAAQERQDEIESGASTT